MKFGWLLSSLLLSMMMYGQVDHWESIVHDTMPWHYMIPDNTTSADWTSPTFDESAWMSGKGDLVLEIMMIARKCLPERFLYITGFNLM